MKPEPDHDHAADLAEVRIAVYAPTGRDTDLVCRFLKQRRLACAPCDDFEQVVEHIAGNAGPVILTEEVLTASATGRLLALLDEEPDWSDLPVVILGGKARWPEQVRRLAARRNTTVIDRPLTAVTLLTVVEAAVDAWQRQQHVRLLLEDLRRLNAELTQRADQLQRLTRELTEAEHRERKRLSQVLHDHLQQILVGAKMRLNQLKSEQAPSAAAVDEIEQLIDESVQVARSLATDLSPPFLHDATPVEMLEWLARRMQQQQGLTVHMPVRDDVEGLREDLKILLHEAAKELLFNIVKHAGVDEATVELHHDPGGELRLVVEDAGGGFEAPREDRVAAAEGGMGLFRLKERLNHLGGSLSMQSTPGKGTRAEVCLPVERSESEEPAHPESPAVPEEPAAPPPAAQGPGPRKVRVLIADDHTVVRQGLRSLLESMPDLEVVGEADNGWQTVERTRELHPDIVIMDVSMPEMDGIEATRRITEEHTCRDIVGLSMHQSEDMAEKMHQAGARTYLTKDKAMEQLIEVVRAFGKPAGPAQ